MSPKMQIFDNLSEMIQSEFTLANSAVSHFSQEVHVSNTNVSHAKFWTRSFHTWIRYFISKNVHVSYVKILQFRKFFVCKWHVKFSRGKSFVSSWPRVNCLKFIFLEVWELGDVLRWQINVRQALSMEKRFLSPRRGSNPQPSDDRWDALTIELPRVRWWAKVHVRHMCDLSGSHYLLIMKLMKFVFLETWKLGDILRW